MSKKKTIAILEDDSGIRRLLSSILSKEGFSVIEASSGIELIEKIIPQNPSLFIIDIMLPYLPGQTVIDAFRKKNIIDEGTPIIVISAKEEEEIKRVAAEVNAAAYFKKPIDNDLLIETVKKLIDS